jgi:hypothetical protein
MKRFLPLTAVFVLVVVLSHTRPALAQFGAPRFGGGQSVDEEIQDQRKKQMSQHQQYTKPQAKPTAPGANAPRSYTRTPADAIGRVDLAGRAAPRYPTVRDGSIYSSPSQYSHGRRTPVKRPQAPRLFPGVGTSRKSQ